jgi:hypothetical protein
MKAYEVLTLVSYKNIDRKFIKKYIVISDVIPTKIEDLEVGREDEEFIESRLLSNYKVVIK